MGSAAGVGQVMIASQDDDGYLGLDQTPYTAGKGALPGRIRVAVLINIAGKDGEMYLACQGIINGVLYRALKIEQAAIEPGSDVKAAIIFHPEVYIGEMEDIERHLNCLQTDR
jgi:hypothetical protein